MKRRLIAVLSAAVLLFGMMGGAAIGFHPAPVVTPHQHFINGQRVGPNACADGPSLAFDHFHMNIHLGKPGLNVFRGDGGGLGLVTPASC